MLGNAFQVQPARTPVAAITCPQQLPPQCIAEQCCSIHRPTPRFDRPKQSSALTWGRRNDHKLPDGTFTRSGIVRFLPHPYRLQFDHVGARARIRCGVAKGLFLDHPRPHMSLLTEGDLSPPRRTAAVW